MKRICMLCCRTWGNFKTLDSIGCDGKVGRKNRRWNVTYKE